MKKRTLVCVLMASFCMCLVAGCGTAETEEGVRFTYTDEVVEQDTTTLELEADYETGQTSVLEEIPVEGEEFSLVCIYDTGDYPLDEWRVTDSKGINMTVTTNGLPESYAVHIEHMHADIVLKSTEPQIDGITQDTMDDSDHRVPTNGFPISDTIAYNNTFAIEGYTDQFYVLWGYAFGTYGRFSSSYARLTEGNIREVGTYAEKLIVIYDIVISTPDCEEGYVRSVRSEVLIPLTSEIKTVERDFWTDEIVE